MALYSREYKEKSVKNINQIIIGRLVRAVHCHPSTSVPFVSRTQNVLNFSAFIPYGYLWCDFPKLNYL